MTAQMRRRALAALCMLLGWGAAPRPVLSQQGECERGGFRLLRYEENYAFLRNRSCRSRSTDVLKYLAVRKDDRAFVSFGGMMRQRFERLRDADWGRGLVDADGYLLLRYMAHADIHLASWRAFADLTSNHVIGRNGGPRPVDADALDVHQLFVDVPLFAASRGFARMRAGRQEIALGSERLVSVRDGPNVRQSFDGVRATYTRSDWTMDAFATAPVRTSRGTFDDRAEPSQRFWGAQFTRGTNASAFATDIYYLGIRKDRARFDQGIEREERHSVGMRAFGKANGFDYDIELVDQWGTFGAGRIRAWTVASHVGYAVEGLPRPARIGLKADVTSGDDDPSDTTLQTFNPLFPRGGYFGAASLIGPQNHVDLHPSIDVFASKRVTISGDWDFFWRQRLSDGQYTIAGALQVPANGSRERYVGSQASATTMLKVNEYVSVMANYGHFFAGPFLMQAGSSRGVDYMTLWVDYRF